MRLLLLLLAMALFGVAKLPAEQEVARVHRESHFRFVNFDLGLRERIGQFGFIAALSGLRSIIADALFVQAHVAWERTEWGRVLFLMREVTSLQPRSVLFWDIAAWHMAWNAGRARPYIRGMNARRLSLPARSKQPVEKWLWNRRRLRARA